VQTPTPIIPKPQEQRPVEVKPNTLTIDDDDVSETTVKKIDDVEPAPGKLKKIFGSLWQKVNNSLSDDGDQEFD
jgi:hypothetical protein